MKNIIIVLILLSVNLLLSGQTTKNWEEEKYKKVFTAQNANYLDSNQKAIVHLMNMARADGKLFAKTWLPIYVKNRQIKPTSYLKSLYRDLENLPSLPPIIPSLGLSLSSKDHADDIGPKGKFGHKGSNGSKLSERISKYAVWDIIVAENIFYGGTDAIDIVCGLLVDEDNPELGHRKNIFNVELRCVGVAITKHESKYKNVFVSDFAGAISKELFEK